VGKISATPRNLIVLRTNGLAEGECIVCPQHISSSHAAKPIPKNLVIDGLPTMVCCSTQCRAALHGASLLRPKGKAVLQRLGEWVTKQLGSPLRAGDAVELLRDTSANRLVEAGPGTVIKVHFDRDLKQAVFRVQHVLDARVYEVTQSGLVAAVDVSAMESRLRDSKKPRVSLPTSTQLTWGAELEAARVAAGGQQLVACKERKRANEEKSKRTSAEFLAETERCRADAAHASIGHIYARSEGELASAEAAATEAEARTLIAQEEAAKARSYVAEIRKRSRVEKFELERAANNAKAALYRCETTSTMFTVGAAQAAASEGARADEAQAMANSAAMERDDALIQVAKFSEPTMESLVQILAPGGGADALLKKNGGLDSLVTSAKAMDPSSRQHADYQRAVNLCGLGLIEVCAAGDPARVDMLTHSLGGSLQKKARCDGTLWSESPRAVAFERLQGNIVDAWRGAKRNGFYGVARQLLSLFAPRAGSKKGGPFSQANIAALVSEILPVRVNDSVRVLPLGATRNSSKLGVCIAINTVLDEFGEEHRTYDIAPVVLGGRGRESSSFLLNLPENRIWHVESIVCTVAEVQAASDHAKDFHAGAVVPERRLVGWTRMTPLKSEITATLLRSRSVVRRSDGGRSTAKEGVKWLLAVGLPVLLRRLNKLLQRAQQTPMSRQTLGTLVGGREYSTLTALKCVCSTCRDLGFVGFELWREVIKELVPESSPMGKKLNSGIDEEERFMNGEFWTHLEDGSPTASHCVGHQLSSYNNESFRVDCVHGRADGKITPPAISMAQRVAPRQIKSSDWADACIVCSASHDDDRSLLQCCENCPAAAHKQCILMNFPDLGSTWTCPQCVAFEDARQHDTRCTKCETHSFLVEDTKNLAKHVRAEALAAGGSADRAEWALAAMENIDIDIQQYRAHMVRDYASNRFEFWAVETLEAHQWTDLYDYWAKQQEKRAAGGLNAGGTGVCEGQANIGISVHGRCWTYRNPPQSGRDKWPEVPWDLYPPPPELGGPKFCRDYRRSFSNSSTQDAFDTAATKLAEDKEFLGTHPWLTEHKGALSDGASNYNTTQPLLYDILNPNAESKVSGLLVGRSVGSCRRRRRFGLSVGWRRHHYQHYLICRSSSSFWAVSQLAAPSLSTVLDLSVVGRVGVAG
jgi:hypothetical protein